MTIKSSGQLGITEIDAEFGLGKSLLAHRGATWWTDSGSTGTFPVSGELRSPDDFYGKRKTAPSLLTYFVIVGGGGGGATGTQDNIGGGGGGGGGGGVLQSQFNFQFGTSASVTIGAGGTAGFYGDTGQRDGYGNPINSWIRAGNGNQTSLNYGSYYWRGTGGERGYARYYFNGGPNGATSNEAVAYKGGNSGYSNDNGTLGASNPGGAYHTAGSSGNNRGGGGGGGVDDSTNTNGVGGDGAYVFMYGSNFVGIYGGGGGGGGDYSGGAAGGAGGGGGHGGTSVSYQGFDGQGGGGAGGDSYGGSASSNGARGGHGTIVLATVGSTSRFTISGGGYWPDGWDNAYYDSSSGLYFYKKITPGVYTISMPAA